MEINPKFGADAYDALTDTLVTAEDDEEFTRYCREAIRLVHNRTPDSKLAGHKQAVTHAKSAKTGCGFWLACALLIQAAALAWSVLT